MESDGAALPSARTPCARITDARPVAQRLLPAVPSTAMPPRRAPGRISMICTAIALPLS
ncbi:hypothetical protein FM110_04150 [Brachybacterium nesterenkovii]|uniref:Uncharacterized protein n=1 Tax=Brachybacterium nesterenkovii TaxID=47847 RepID=A0A1X6WVX5_9MICO|nr:hypothetical protein FM110_04150 [Brachybacterium nesterenkovii]